MQKFFIQIFIFSVFTCSFLAAQDTNENWNKLAGSAFIENHSYDMLQMLCDQAGGRMMGSANNQKAMNILSEELKKYGLNAKLEPFTVPGWVRGEDEVVMTLPVEKHLLAIALGYIDKTPEFEAEAFFAGYGFSSDYKSQDLKGKIALVTSERPKGKEPLLRYEAIDIASQMGAKAILFINDNAGTLNLAGTGNFQGTPAPIPAFSLNYEEGMWLKRLLEKGQKVKLSINTRSYCKVTETSNLVFSLPGKVKEKIVIGAHFDSWDISQGAIDNGIGSAILFDVARLINRYSPNNYYSIDFVWFNGEEFGLWGSKKYVEMHKSDNIAAMINMDMTGAPTGFNVMGFEEFIPFFEQLKTKLNGFDLTSGVVNIPYTNSDHIPFMFRGIPTFSLQAHLEDEMVRYYHSSGDTFDKVNKKYLSEASAVVCIMLSALANFEKLSSGQKNPGEMADLFRKYHLDDRLKRQKEWIYGN
ncbi:MAG: M28 family peptidase [Bacillota bacterium]